MITRPYFAQLTEPHTQFDLADQRFNHDAIAIYLHEKNKRVWKNRPVYLVAGSEDLRDLLTRLPLQFDGDEAFIFYRSHTHAIVISLLRLNGKLIAYYYDPQAWGTTSYPTRLAYDVLLNTYPEISIFASTVEIQPKSNQRGCTEYAFDCLNYLLKPDCNWMAMLQSQPSTLNTESIYMLDQTVYPQVLKDMLVSVYHATNKVALENWLTESYVNQENNELRWPEIERVVRVMQGAELPQWLFDGPMLYTTQVDLDKPSVTLRFPHADYIHANCLLYTESRFPSSNADGIVLDDNPNIKVSHHPAARTLTFTADSVEKLLTAFTELSNAPGRYVARQMRQQQGLKAFAREMLLAIQIEREMIAVLNNTKGGLDSRQVQQALQFIFRNDQTTIYVPHYVELSGENTKIDLLDLKQRGFKSLIATMPLDNEHQVAIQIDLTGTPFYIYTYNSSQYGHSESKLKKHLSAIFGEDIALVNLPTHFKSQTKNDIWACGVHVIANLEAEFGRRASTPNDVLNAKLLARTYLRAWHFQQEEDEKQWNYRHACVTFTEQLHRALQEASGFPTESLLKFLSGYVGTSHTELRRATPVPQLLREYEKTNTSDTFGIIVLRFCNLTFPKLDSCELARIFAIAKNPPASKSLYEDASRKYDSSWLHYGKNDLTDQTYDAVLVDLQLYINQHSNPLEFLRQTLSLLLKDKPAENRITKFFKLIDCGYSTSELKDKDKFIQSIIIEICSQAAKYDGVQLGEKRNIQIERIAKDERVKKHLTQLGVYQGEMTPEISELMQLPENVIITLTSRIHLAILSVVTDSPSKIATVKKLISLPRDKHRDAFDLLNCIDESLRPAAANAILKNVPAEVLEQASSNRDAPKLQDRLIDCVLKNSFEAHIKNPELLIACVREWKAAGLKLSVDMLEGYKKHFNVTVMREFFETVVGNEWTKGLLKKYVKYLKRSEYFPFISKIVWQGDASLLQWVMKSNFHRFSDEEVLALFTGFKGTITREQLSHTYFGCRKSYSVYLDHDLNARRITNFDQALCEWVFLNRPNLLSVKSFFATASEKTILDATTKRNATLAMMIAKWDDRSQSVTEMVSQIDSVNVDKFLYIYADELSLDADIIKYIRSLPPTEKAVAVMCYHPLVSDLDALREMLESLSSTQKEAYIRQHIDKFDKPTHVEIIVKCLGDSPYVVEVIAAKTHLFSGKLSGCSCGDAYCDRRGTSSIAKILDEVSSHALRYEMLVKLLHRHASMREVIASLDKLTREYEKKILTTFNVQLAEVVRKSSSDYLAAISTHYDRETTQKFVEIYVPYFDERSLITSLALHQSCVSNSLMRGKPLVHTPSALIGVMSNATFPSRYLILQRNVGVLKSIDDFIEALNRLSHEENIQFLLDYDNHIISVDKSRSGSQLSNLFELPLFAASRALCMRYIRHAMSISDYIAVLKKPCLSNDDRMELIAQPLSVTKDCVVRCIKTLTEPHRDVLALLKSSSDWLASATADEIVTCFEKVLPGDAVALLQEVMKLNINFTAEHALKVVQRLPMTDRDEFISLAITLPGTERWYLLRAMINQNAFTSLACSMITTGDDLPRFAVANRRRDDLMTVVCAKHDLITSDNMVALMGITASLSDYILANKLDLVKTREHLSKVLKEVPDWNLYNIGKRFITDFGWLVTVMHHLSSDEAEKALQTHEALVVNDCDVSLCLRHINKSSRLATAIRYQSRVRNNEHFGKIMLELRRDDCYAYVKASTFQPAISKEWLSLLAPMDRYDYLKKRDLKDAELVEAVTSLMPSHRLIFACEKITDIKNSETYKILRDLFEPDGKAMLDHHCEEVMKKRERTNQIFSKLFGEDDKKPSVKPVVTPSVTRETNPQPKAPAVKGTATKLRGGFFASKAPAKKQDSSNIDQPKKDIQNN